MRTGRGMRPRHLSLLPAERERRLPRLAQSAATWAVDVLFWLVYGGVVAVIVYAICFAPRP